MALFRNAQDVYDCIGKIFEEAITDPEIGPKTKEAGLTIRFDFTEPTSIIYVDFAQGNVFFGDGVPDTEAAVKPLYARYEAALRAAGRDDLIQAAG